MRIIATSISTFLLLVPVATCLRFALPPLNRSTHKILTFSRKTSTNAIHEACMRLALDQARLAYEANEVPIGPIIVTEEAEKKDYSKKANAQSSSSRGDRAFHVIASSHNLVETRYDASAHAELLALRSAAAYTQNWRLYNSTLYSTLEPCPMCLAAAQAFRVDTVVYGAQDLRLGAVETHLKLLEVAEHPYHSCMKTIGGVLAKDSAELMRDFFRERRKQSKAKMATIGLSDDVDGKRARLRRSLRKLFSLRSQR